MPITFLLYFCQFFFTLPCFLGKILSTIFQFIYSSTEELSQHCQNKNLGTSLDLFFHSSLTSIWAMSSVHQMSNSYCLCSGLWEFLPGFPKQPPTFSLFLYCHYIQSFIHKFEYYHVTPIYLQVSLPIVFGKYKLFSLAYQGCDDQIHGYPWNPISISDKYPSLEPYQPIYLYNLPIYQDAVYALSYF